MHTLQAKLAAAIELRQSEKHEAARAALLELHTAYPADAQVNLQCAWIHDLLGLEREAIPFYEQAIAAGLNDTDLKDALLGLGSTYRALGNYQKASATFEKARAHFPDLNQFKVFHALTLYNLKEHTAAMELLLTTLLDTSTDRNILAYERALRFYSDKLDETW
jgi:tetratricopeptide (TPR) repeat protein